MLPLTSGEELHNLVSTISVNVSLASPGHCPPLYRTAACRKWFMNYHYYSYPVSRAWDQRGCTGPCFRERSRARGLTRLVVLGSEGPLLSFCARNHRSRSRSSCRQPTRRSDTCAWKVWRENSRQPLCVQKSRPAVAGLPPHSRAQVLAGRTQAALSSAPRAYTLSRFLCGPGLSHRSPAVFKLKESLSNGVT